MEFKIPTSNPAVRERVTLMNAKLESAAGERVLKIDPRCRELIKDFEQVTYKENSSGDRQGPGSEEDAFVGCAGVSGVAGVPGAGEGGRAGMRLI